MRKDTAAMILASFRGMHQRNRAVHTAYGVEQLGVTESSLLQEAISRQEGVTAVELCRLLALNSVKVSRLVKSMQEAGIISRQVRDGRLIIVVTERGRRLFFDAYARAQLFFNTAFERVPQQQRKEFSKTFKLFCDSLDAPEAGSLPQDPPLMVEIRRVTRAFGFLARDAFRSGRSPLEWHVLYLIAHGQRRISCRGLATDLGTTHTTMTTVLNRLEKAGWIVRELGEKDARERLLRLTSEGQEELNRIDKLGIALCSKGIAGLDEAARQAFAADLKSYAGHLSDSGVISLGPTVFLSLMKGSELAEARSFVVQQRVKQRLLDKIPASLLNEEHYNFAIRKGGELLAIFELTSKPKAPEYLLVQGIAVERSHDLKPAVLRTAYEEMRKSLRGTRGDAGELPDISLMTDQLSRGIARAWQR